MRRVYALGHNDLDGVASVAAVVKAHPGLYEHVVVDFASYNDIDVKLLRALTEKVTPYDRIVVSDICPEAPTSYTVYRSDDHYRMVNETMPKAIAEYTAAGGQFVVLDHHGGRTQACKDFYKESLHSLSILESKDADGISRAGSELAGRYYQTMRQGLDSPARIAATRDWMRVCGAYDCWRKGPDFDFGANLAMAMSLMNDNHGVLRNMLKLIDRAADAIAEGQFLADTGFMGWERLLSGTTLGAYADMAEVKFEAVVAEARRTAIVHSPKLTEIYVNFFESLVAEIFYNENQGVVAMRYVEDRDQCKKLSFRAHGDAGIHLGEALTPLGGGGHPPAAGIDWRDKPELGYTVDFVIAYMMLQLHPPVPAVILESESA